MKSAPPQIFPMLSAAVEDLATALSVAVRIEPELIRAVRLRVLPYLDVGVEADLWFSEVVDRQPGSIILEREARNRLRERLTTWIVRAEPADGVRQIWSIIAEVHARTSPALLLEEHVTWLAISGKTGAPIERELRRALYALVHEGRSGIADWFAGAWDRMPAQARTTKTAWLLRQTSRVTVPIAQVGRQDSADVTLADLADIVSFLPDVTLPVRRDGLVLEVGALAVGPDVRSILVPDTDPRILEVLPSDGSRRASTTLTVRAGEVARVAIGPGPVQLGTARGAVYLVPDDKPSRRTVPIEPPVSALPSSDSSRAAEVVLAELDSLVGLAEVKTAIRDLAVQLGLVHQLSHEPAGPPHLLFIGGPGTAKTTVAELIGRLFAALGLLTRGHLVVATRTDLVGVHHIGQSTNETRERVLEALDGVLFIDEAYELARTGFERESLDTLLSLMEAHRGRLSVIFAGNSHRMGEFLSGNPAVASRFPHRIEFADYTVPELGLIFARMAEQEGFGLETGVQTMAEHWLEDCRVAEGENFGNARAVRRLLSLIEAGVALRQGQGPTYGTLILREDVPNPVATEIVRERALRTRRRRIGVVDDHRDLVGGALARRLASDPELEVVAAEASEEELLSATTSLDLVVMDIQGHDTTLTERMQKILDAGIANIMIYTHGGSPSDLLAAVRGGALAIVRKSDPWDFVVAAIRSASSGELVASADWAIAIESDDLDDLELTESEWQVLHLFASGEGVSRIARQLEITPDAVQRKVKSIRAKYILALTYSSDSGARIAREPEFGSEPDPGWSTDSPGHGVTYPETFAGRLNILIDTLHPPGQPPYTDAYIAAALTRRGHPISEEYLTQLRDGQLSTTSDETISALSKFFRVNPKYFLRENPIGTDFDYLRIARLEGYAVRGLLARVIELSDESRTLLISMAEKLRTTEGLAGITSDSFIEVVEDDDSLDDPEGAGGDKGDSGH
ncbi:AAA family ATPase [Nocardia sp. CA-120079]|uniref:AAA family ATPase n=1 Tax=Nocardia sp. CA-120079 TaxID=3239974 RepID=UPI003D980579